MSERPPTLDQVAERAGVGRGTASRVLNGSAQVSEAARAAVLRAVDELGYVPNRAARSLVTRATDTVALVVSESEERVFEEPFFAQIVRHVSTEVRAAHRQLMVTMAQPVHSGSGEQRSRLEDYLSRHLMDGVLLLSLHADDPLPEQLAAWGVPAVLGGRPRADVPLTYVDVDNAGGAQVAVEHLVATGRRRIATVTGPQDMTAGQQRLLGYRSALTAAGLGAEPDLVARGDFSEASGWRATRELLTRVPGLDAIFCASDAMALGALTALAEAGRSVPDEVAVVGFDDVPAARYARPRLTTVHQPIEAMARHLVRLLGQLIDGEPAEPVVLDTHLVVRESA